jgi:hypothetical protein
MSEKLQQLSPDQVRRFVVEGLLPIEPLMPEGFHDAIYRRLQELIGHGTDANPGNNLLAMLPELADLFDDPIVHGALTSILGPGYILHPHRAAHNNRPTSSIDPWHKETHGGSGFKVRNHRPWWLMLLYYPQDTTPEMGPTGMVPGSQVLDAIPNPPPPAQVRSATCVKGGCYLMHYDLWHRRQESRVERDRYLVKFEVTRRRPPCVDSPLLDGDDSIPPVWGEPWCWLTGSELHASNRSLSELVQAQADPEELAGLNATYELAQASERGLAVLASALADPTRHGRRRAAYGLAAARSAITGLMADYLECSSPDDEEGRQLVAFALGENGHSGPGRVRLLARLAADPAARVRATATEALGMVGLGSSDVVSALVPRLRDENDEVRYHAALALARVGPEAAQAVPELARSLRDNNRYVQGFAVEALESIGTPDALSVLVPFLKAARWCRYTSPRSPC